MAPWIDVPGAKAETILSTCCKDREASSKMPPFTNVIVGGHRPMEPDTNMVSPTYETITGFSFSARPLAKYQKLTGEWKSYVTSPV